MIVKGRKNLVNRKNMINCVSYCAHPFQLRSHINQGPFCPDTGVFMTFTMHPFLSCYSP